MWWTQPSLFPRQSIFANDFFIILRQKVDLTKYIEQHSFHFDAAYNDNISNQDVSNTPSEPLILLALLGCRSTIGQFSFQRGKSQLLCLWTNWIWKNLYHDGWRLWRCPRTLSLSNQRYFCTSWKTAAATLYCLCPEIHQLMPRFVPVHGRAPVASHLLIRTRIGTISKPFPE